MNIDTLFTKIINQHFNELNFLISKRDFQVLTSLAKSINSSSYITEKQGSLLLRVLSENLNHFKTFNDDIEFFINNPIWSKPFRQVEQIKKIYLKEENGFSRIYYELSSSGHLKKVILDLSSVLSGFSQHNSVKLCSSELTERNIIESVDALSKYNFDIDETILSYYNTIKSWKVEDYKNKFLISTIPNPDFQKYISEDLGINTPLTSNIINDRSIRYQYYVDRLSNPTSLTEIIANRDSSNLWLCNSKFSLDQIIRSLIELRRLPILIVFDMWDSKRCTTELNMLISALESNNIKNNIGIYFRVSNEKEKSEFNQIIADRNYNCHLDDTTKIVGVQNGKIPKFFLQSSWTPMSVISLCGSLKNNKTAVYSNCCDLIISYSATQPLIESKASWLN